MEALFPGPTLLLVMVLMLVLESECLTDEPERPLLVDVVNGRRCVVRTYEWSWNLLDPKRLLLIRRLTWDPFVDVREAADDDPCSTELLVAEVTFDRTEKPPASEGTVDVREPVS